MHKILVELEFTSDRARMSVVARAPDSTIRLFTKGSDAVSKAVPPCFAMVHTCCVSVAAAHDDFELQDRMNSASIAAACGMCCASASWKHSAGETFTDDAPTLPR
jgi:Cation transport ATPase (P-type)